MLLHCAIVEDAVVDARKLACSLQTATEGKHELSVSFFESGDALLKSHSPADYDVAFLDICMPGTNGIETARQLRELSPSLPLIFITSSGDHVWQALSIHPFDYLLKPYSEATISKLLSDLLRTIRHVEREVEVRSERKALHIPLNKIHYILALLGRLFCAVSGGCALLCTGAGVFA